MPGGNAATSFNPPPKVTEAARRAFAHRQPSRQPPRLTRAEAIAALRATGLSQVEMERIWQQSLPPA